MSDLIPLDSALRLKFAWAEAPACRRVIAALERAAPAGARFVGGCVRNPLIGAPVADVDIATVLEPAETIAALEAAGITAVPTGLAHGTITAVAEGEAFEITSLRADVDTDGRHATVQFTRDWEEDWRRRDFTINAIYLTPDYRLWDPAGGADDARDGRLRFIGAAAARIREDYLRILRFYRFWAQYPSLDMTAEDEKVCARMRDGVARLSRERIRDELMKLLAAPRAGAALRKLDRNGVWRQIGLGDPNADRLDRLAAIEAGLGRPPSPWLRLAAAASSSADDLADALRLSNAARRLLRAATAPEAPIHRDMSETEARSALYRLGRENYEAAALLVWAEEGRSPEDEAWRRIIGLPDRWTPPEFPVSGDDLRAAGVSPGPELGRLLRGLEARWLEMGMPARDVMLCELTEVLKMKGAR
ncbi:MAG: CCA tRNA nucleotidyltransferase [Parvularculaceae bacterium]